MPLSKVWIHAEIGGDKPSSISLELATKARELGDTVEAFYAGDNPEGVAEELGKYGVSKVYAVDTGGTLQGVPGASAMADQINAGNAPDLVMFGSTYDGRDVLGRLSVMLDKPVLTNNNAVTLEGDEIRVSTAIFGGTSIVSTAYRHDGPHLANFRPKSFEASEGGATSATVEQVSASEQSSAKVLERHVEEHEGPVLDEANLVVSGGRGLGSAENY